MQEIACENGFNEIALESGITREKAHKFWIEKCGFSQVRFGFKRNYLLGIWQNDSSNFSSRYRK